MACSTTGTNGDIDSAFDSISDLMKGPGKEKKFAPSLETSVVLLQVCGSASNLVQPGAS